MPSSILLGLTLLVFCTLRIVVVEGCLILNGQTPVFQDNRNGVRRGFRDQTHAISRDLQFSCYGSVTGWAAYVERAGTFLNVKFQVWRLMQEDTNTECTTYRLVGSHSFDDVATDANKLLNISSVMDFDQNPIPVQPGDMVGFYGDFDRVFNDNINIQSNPSEGVLSYFSSGATSTDVDNVTVASNCDYLSGREGGSPVITAYVVIQEAVTTPISETVTPQLPTTFEPTTQLTTTAEPVTTSTTEELTPPPQTTSMATSTAEVPQTTAELTSTAYTTEEIQETTSRPTTTTDLTPEATSELIPTTDYVESTTEVIFIAETTPDKDLITTTEEAGDGSMGNSTQQDDSQQKERAPIPDIVLLSIIIVLVLGIVVVILCLVIGSCICRRHHRKQRSYDLTILSFNAPDGNRHRTDSHIYCEMSEVKKDRTESFSDLDHMAVFKDLDCSCKIPHHYPMADYEVPLTTLQRRSLANIGGGRDDSIENTYETPLDAKSRMQQEALFKDGSEGKMLESVYEVPKPMEEEEYTFMASVPRESRLSEAADTIYENVVNQ